MRPIDADALFAKIKERHDMFADCEYIGDKARRDELCAFMGDIVNAPTIGGWISVKDRPPVETHSMFWPLYGTKKWSKDMWREQSDKVLITVVFIDGVKIVTTGETHDGVWHTGIGWMHEPVVTHWMPLPEPPRDDEKETKTDERV